MIYRLKRWWFKTPLTERSIWRTRIMLYTSLAFFLGVVTAFAGLGERSLTLAASAGALWCIAWIFLAEFHAIPWSRKHRDNNPYE